MLKRLANWIQPIVLGLALLFITGLLASQWSNLRAYPWRLHNGWLALSALFMLVSWLIEIGLWRTILHLISISRKQQPPPTHESRITNHDPTLPYFSAMRFWFLSAITRYIPGNIWQPLSLTIYCRRWGFAPEATMTSVLFYQIVLLLSSIPIAAFYFGVTRNFGLLTEYLNSVIIWLIPLGVIPLLAFLLRPDWLICCINWALQKTGRDPLNATLGWRDLLRLILVAICHWITWGICFATLTIALSDFTTAQMLDFASHLITVYAIAYTIGYLSVITPSGLGVREGAFFVLLTPLMGATAVTVAALAMRLWTTVGELFAAAISAGFDFYDQRADRQKKSSIIASDSRADLEKGADHA